jgi:hypothetical protein
VFGFGSDEFGRGFDGVGEDVLDGLRAFFK